MISRNNLLFVVFALVLSISVISCSPLSHNNEEQDVDVLGKLEKYIKNHEFSIDVPATDSKLVVSARNLDSNELDVKLKVSGGAVESRKSKLKKVFIPIFVFILMKAMTLIPLALGVLGLKAWNSLQLSFFSFMISVGLAIFQLCKKLAADSHPAQIVAPWESARGLIDDYLQSHLENHDVVYNGHA